MCYSIMLYFFVFFMVRQQLYLPQLSSSLFELTVKTPALFSWYWVCVNN